MVRPCRRTARARESAFRCAIVEGASRSRRPWPRMIPPCGLASSALIVIQPESVIVALAGREARAHRRVVAGRIDGELAGQIACNRIAVALATRRASDGEEPRGTQ